MSSTIIKITSKAIILAVTASLLCVSAAGPSRADKCSDALKQEGHDEHAVIEACYENDPNSTDCAKDKKDVCDWLDKVKKFCAGPTKQYFKTHTGKWKEHYCAAACNKGPNKDTANPGTVCP